MNEDDDIDGDKNIFYAVNTDETVMTPIFDMDGSEIDWDLWESFCI